VRVTDVVYAQRLDQPATFDELRYLLFGRGDELFLGHLLSRPLTSTRSCRCGWWICTPTGTS
jgi:hypothetical protein